MNTTEYIKSQVLAARASTEGVLKGITDEMLNWAPPGTANKMGLTLLHMIGSQDFFIQQILQGKPRVWDTGGWALKVGVPEPPSRGRGWVEIVDVPLSLVPIVAYRNAVLAATDEFLADCLPGEDLERMADFPAGRRSVATLLTMLLSNDILHTGEIAVLKGLQGVEGLPI